jgi:hypothetical protein
MTLVYDSSGVASRLGADLQQFSSNGWNPSGTAQDKGRTFWDGGQNIGGSSPVNAYAQGYVDLIVHQGALHVAWVEHQWNGSVRLARGPYVSRWNGSSWVALGGEVDPSITPVDITYPSPGFGSFEMTDTVGTRWRPGRPKLVSDGTSLFCVYTVQEVVTAPASAYLPLAGSTGPGGNLVGVTHPFNRWAPRKVYVRKWNTGGGTWDLYGSLDALTSNNGAGAGAAPAPGTAAAPSGGTASCGFLLDIGASASPNQLGVVYVAMMEQGANSPANYYNSGGTYFFAPNRCVLQAAKFDGSSTAGTVTQIIDESSQTTWNSTLNSGFAGSVNGQSISAVSEDSVRCKNEHGGMVFWYNNTRVPAVTGVRMTAIDTNVDKTSDAVSINTNPWLVTYQSSRGKYLLQQNSGKCECSSDGSDAAFSVSPTRWNGDNATGLSIAMVAEGGLDDQNVWLVSSADIFNSSVVVLYHHNCFAMTSESFPTPSNTTEVPVGAPVLAVIGDTLYAAAAVRDSTNVLVDLKVRVYSIPITRGGGGSCAGNSAALTGSGSGSCSTATLNGTVNPNNALGGVTVYFEYGPTTSYGSTVTVGTVTGTSQAVAATATGLSPGGTYHFRVNLIAPDGSVVHGADATFTEGSCPAAPYLHAEINLSAT